MEPLLCVLYSLLIGIILYIIFRYIMNLTNKMSQVSAIIAASLSCIYLVIINELKNFSLLK